MEAKACKNCGTPVDDKFCPHCGQKTDTVRVTMKHMLRGFFPSTVKLDTGFTATLKLMFTNPGELIRGYLEGRRVKYLTPFKYFTLTMGVVIALHLQLGIGDIMISSIHLSGNDELFRVQLIKFIFKYFNVLQFIMLPVISWLTFIFFRQHKYNYAENIVINSYLFAQRNVMYIVFIFLMYLLQQHEVIISYFYIVLWMIYFCYGYISVFKPKNKPGAVLKSLSAIITFMLVYSLLMIAIFALFFYSN